MLPHRDEGYSISPILSPGSVRVGSRRQLAPMPEGPVVAWNTPEPRMDYADPYGSADYSHLGEFEGPHMAPVIDFMSNCRDTLQTYIPCKVTDIPRPFSCPPQGDETQQLSFIPHAMPGSFSWGLILTLPDPMPGPSRGGRCDTLRRARLPVLQM